MPDAVDGFYRDVLVETRSAVEAMSTVGGSEPGEG
jgi:hypothetical protein